MSDVAEELEGGVGVLSVFDEVEALQLGLRRDAEDAELLQREKDARVRAERPRLLERAERQIADLGDADELDRRHHRRVGGEERRDARRQKPDPQPAAEYKPGHQRGGAGLAVGQGRRERTHQVRSRLDDDGYAPDYVGCQHGG